jgi:hypothetical protein
LGANAFRIDKISTDDKGLLAGDLREGVEDFY